MELTICCINLSFRGMKDLFLYQDDRISVVCEPEFTRISVKSSQRLIGTLCLFAEAITTTLLRNPSVGNANTTFIQLYPKHIFQVSTNIFLCVH